MEICAVSRSKIYFNSTLTYTKKSDRILSPDISQIEFSVIGHALLAVRSAPRALSLLLAAGALASPALRKSPQTFFVLRDSNGEAEAEHL